MQHELYGTVRSIEATHWWYVGRRQIIFDWIQRVVPPGRRRVLDVGCGTGFNLEQLTDGFPFDVVGSDISGEALAFCRERGVATVVQADAARPPFREASFDLILALDVIEHVQDDERALSAIERLLRPGGYLLIFTPAFMFLWSEHDRASHHFRRYTRPELRSKLEAAGFAVEKLSYANTVLFPAVWLGRLLLRGAGDSAAADLEMSLPPRWINRVLSVLFSAEHLVLRRMSLPVGVSILAAAKKVRP